MDIINVLPYCFWAMVSIMLARVCVFVLDIPIFNEMLGLDRERRKIAEKFKLTLESDKDRERVNKKIALYNLGAILYIVFAGGLIYFILIPGITEWLN